jgi:hypothetical protein
MPPQDGYFFFWGEMLPFLPHTFAPLSQRTNAVLHFQQVPDLANVIASVRENALFDESDVRNAFMSILKWATSC